MKLALVLPLLASGTSAFTSPQEKASSTRWPLSMVDASKTINSSDEYLQLLSNPKVAYPTVNGWTADPDKFCAGLPGAVAPLGQFDPLGFTTDLPVQEIKRYRESEVTHGRVAMLAVVGYLVAERYHPMFGGSITGPANTHLAQVISTAPFYFAFLVVAVTLAEFGRALIGWEFPLDAVVKNQEVEGKTWLSKLNDDYYPGDIGFDPLGFKPRDPEEFADMQTKELQNGRLAMIAAMGMIVQEQVTQQPLFPAAIGMAVQQQVIQQPFVQY